MRSRLLGGLRPFRHLSVPFVAACLVVVMASPTNAVLAGWTAPVRVFSTSAAVQHSMVLDGLGNVHIAVAGGASAGISYITNASGSWVTSKVTNADDRDPSIGVDDEGNVVIAFARYVAGSKGIYTATGGGPWPVTLRHAGADSLPSMILRDGDVHIAFKGPNSKLDYMEGGDGLLTPEVVDSNCCGGAPSLRLASGGQPRIAYSRMQNGTAKSLMYAAHGGSGWSLTTVESGATKYPRMVLSDDDRPFIAYLKLGAGTWWAQKTTTFLKVQLGVGLFQPPDLAYYSNTLAWVYGDGHKIVYTTMSGGIYFAQTLVNGGSDSMPEIERVLGGIPIVIFDRTGGSKKGVFLTRKP